MDRRIRLLERQAAAGDPAADTMLAGIGCRLGKHVLRQDQILTSEHWTKAGLDTGGCQCGKLIYTAQDLCRAGHHRLHYDGSGELSYWCIRPGLTEREYQSLRLRCREANGFEEWTRIREELLFWEQNPYTYRGCSYHISGDDCCSQGLHFLYQTPEGQKCRNLGCNYKVSKPCHHPSLQKYAQYGPVGCYRCGANLAEQELCAVAGCLPDEVTENPCIRETCQNHQPGTSIYEALAQADQAGFLPQAVCRSRGVTLVTAAGWNKKLGRLGVKKLTRPQRQQLGIVKGCQIRVAPYRRHFLGFNSNYKSVNQEEKKHYDGKWYPLKEIKK